MSPDRCDARGETSCRLKVHTLLHHKHELLNLISPVFDIAAVCCQYYRLCFPQRHHIASGGLTYCWLPSFWTQLLYLCPLPLHLLLSAEMHHSLLILSCTHMYLQQVTTAVILLRKSMASCGGRSAGFGGKQHALFLFIYFYFCSLQHPELTTSLCFSRVTVQGAETYFQGFNHLFFAQMLS